MESCDGTGAGEAWVLRFAFERFVKLINPIIPHIAEELWQALGHKTHLVNEGWPEFDPTLIAQEQVTIAVQINGKVKATIILPPNLDKEATEKAAMQDDSVQKAIGDQQVRKVIVVPNRIVNVVVG